METSVLTVAGMLSVYVVLVMSTLSTQYQNIKNKEYEKAGKFAITILIAIIGVFVVQNTTFIQVAFIENLNFFDAIVFGAIVGLASTGAFDTVKNLTK